MRGGESFDADNDGDTDLFLYDDTGGRTYLYLNDGSGQFTLNDLGVLFDFCSTTSCLSEE